MPVTQDTGAPGPGCCTSVLGALWAKTPEALSPAFSPTPHLLDTAAIVEVLVRSWLRPGLRDLLTQAIAPGDADLAVRRVALAAGLHDLGKINPLFQLQQLDGRHLAWRDAHRTHLAHHGLQPASPATVTAAALWRGRRRSVASRHEHVGGFHLHGDALTRDVRSDEHWVATVVAGHHGRWQVARAPGEDDGSDRICLDLVTGGAWKELLDEQQALIEHALGVAVAATPPLRPDPGGAALILVSGLVMLADWIASEDTWVGHGTGLIADGLDPVAEPGAWLSERRSAARSQVDSTVGLLPSESVESRAAVLGTLEPRPLQSAVLDLADRRGLVTLAAPTGEGKTEAALLRHLSVPNERLVFALPTMATTDAMTARVRRLMHPLGIKVAKGHQHAAFTQLDGVEESAAHLYTAEWHARALRRMLAPAAVVTCDQSHATSLARKNAVLRLLAVANAHNVFDEVHTYSPYQRELFAEELRWLGAVGARVTLLSASLPTTQARQYRQAYADGATRTPTTRRDDDAYRSTFPSLGVFDPERGVDETLTEGLVARAIPPIRMELEAMTEAPRTRAEWALRQSRVHPACHIAVIANTVSEAIATALLVQDDLPETHDLVVLHARMTREQRRERERELLARLGKPPAEPEGLAAYRARRPLIVVATSVIEASLDLDFDLMASDLAPAPSMIQRPGRLWRFFDDTERRRRHASSTVPPERVLTVFVSVTADGQLAERVAPFAVAELAAVRDHLADGLPGGLLDVLDESQDLVDATDPAVVSLAPGQVGAQTLLAAILDELGSVTQWRAQWHDRVTAARKGRIKYGALVDFTTTPDVPDEAPGGTRYQDLPSQTFLLFDSRPCPTPYARPRAVSRSLLDAAAGEVASLQAFSIPVSGYPTSQPMAAMQAAHRATLDAAGIQEWDPRAATLKHQLPVDLVHLDPALASFDPALGLVRT